MKLKKASPLKETINAKMQKTPAKTMEIIINGIPVSRGKILRTKGNPKIIKS